MEGAEWQYMYACAGFGREGRKTLCTPTDLVHHALFVCVEAMQLVIDSFAKAGGPVGEGRTVEQMRPPGNNNASSPSGVSHCQSRAELSGALPQQT